MQQFFVMARSTKIFFIYFICFNLDQSYKTYVSYYDVLHIFLIQDNVHLICIQLSMDENNMKIIFIVFWDIAVSPRLYLGKTPKYIWQLSHFSFFLSFLFLLFSFPPISLTEHPQSVLAIGQPLQFMYTVCDVPLCRVPVISFSPTSLWTHACTDAFTPGWILGPRSTWPVRWLLKAASGSWEMDKKACWPAPRLAALRCSIISTLTSTGWSTKHRNTCVSANWLLTCPHNKLPRINSQSCRYWIQLPNFLWGFFNP